MGKIFGNIAIVIGGILCITVFFAVAFLLSGDILMYTLSALVIILGIIGIVKDDPKGKAIGAVCVGIFVIIATVLIKQAWETLIK